MNLFIKICGAMLIICAGDMLENARGIQINSQMVLELEQSPNGRHKNN